MSKPKVSTIQERAISLEGPREGRHVRASLSSEAPVERIFGTEVLRHDAASVNMERAARGLPLLMNHDGQRFPIGRVRNIHLGNDRKLRGELVFTEATQEARDAWSLVEDGTLEDVSIRYAIQDYEQQRDGSKEIISVTRWMPLEASMVSVPGDGTVGIGRSISPINPSQSEEAPPVEKPKIDEAPAGGASKDDDVIESIRARAQVGYAKGFAEGAAREAKRVNGINNTARLLVQALPALAGEIEALRARCVDDAKIGDDQFRQYALDHIVGGTAEPLSIEAPAPAGGGFAPALPGDHRRGVIQMGRTHNQQAARGIELALLEKCGRKVDLAEMQGNQFRGWSLFDVAETMLRSHGVDTRGMNREQIAKRAIGMRAIEGGAGTYASADFPAVTENVATKLVFDGFATAPRTWDQWCSTGSAPDFKQFTIPRISAFSSLPVVAENAQYQDGTLVDAKESGTLTKRGSLLSLSWEAVINDDMAMFARNAARMGEAAQRTIDEAVYALLLSNAKAGPTMGDAVALFNAAHNNTGTTALSLAGVIATRTAMGRQTDDNGVLLGIRLDKVLVPLELQDTAVDLAQSDNIPVLVAGTDGVGQRGNTVRGTFEVVATPRITDTNDWYGVAPVGQSCEVVFLNGMQAPSLEREMGWSYDTLNWKVRIVFIPVFVDWRGIYRQLVT